MARVNTRGMDENDSYLARFEAALGQAESFNDRAGWGSFNRKEGSVSQGPITEAEVRLADKRRAREWSGRFYPEVWECKMCGRFVYLVAKDDTAFKHIRPGRDIKCGRSAWDLRVAQPRHS